MNLRKRRRMTSYIVKNIRRLGCIIAGCAFVYSPMSYAQLAGVDTESFIASKPPQLQAPYRRLVAGGARDSVLNNMEIATIALRMENHREAADAIDRALLDIKKYYGQTASAAKARSLWYEEGSKEFKGEPYERAMAYYYRGMLDLRLGDYGNAQASFASGWLQDAFAEEKQFRSDFAVLAFLAAWTLERQGSNSLADEWYQKDLAALRPNFKRPPPNHDTLVVIETGKSPRKLADGIGHAELVYRRGKKFKDKKVVLHIGGEHVAFLMEDIYLQASTRGARPVDRILEGKIKFRNANAKTGASVASFANDLSDVALITGNTDMGYIGAGLGVLGAIQMFSASNAKPRADTRYWSGLPDSIHVFTYDSSILGTGDIGVQYLDKNDVVIPEFSITAKRRQGDKGNGLVWIATQN